MVRKQFPEVDCPRGSPRGRSSYGTVADAAPRSVRLFEVNIDNGGYDDGGAYWGRKSGLRMLYCATDGGGYRAFTCSRSRYLAAEDLGIPDQLLKVSVRPWRNLPNARHIDAIMLHMLNHPKKWAAAWGAARGAARGAAWGAARGAAWDAARDAARGAARGATRNAAWGARVATRGAATVAARAAVWDAARDAAWGAYLALIAWDDAGELLDADMDLMKFLVEVQDPRAVLLMPARIAMQEDA